MGRDKLLEKYTIVIQAISKIKKLIAEEDKILSNKNIKSVCAKKYVRYNQLLSRQTKVLNSIIVELQKQTKKEQSK